jgi:hypothetical protein
MTERKRKTQTIDGKATRGKAEFQPERYDISHLDRIDGHVSDFNYEAPQPPAIYQRPNLVLPAQQAKRGELTQRQGAALAAGYQITGLALQQPDRSTHARQDDNAVIIAHAHNIASRPKLIIFGAVLLVLVIGITFYWQLDARGFVLAVMGGAILWGGVALLFLERDRKTALWHSASGIEHHAIDDHGETSRLAIREFARVQRELINGGGYDHE